MSGIFLSDCWRISRGATVRTETLFVMSGAAMRTKTWIVSGSAIVRTETLSALNFRWCCNRHYCFEWNCRQLYCSAALAHMLCDALLAYRQMACHSMTWMLIFSDMKARHILCKAWSFEDCAQMQYCAYTCVRGCNIWMCNWWFDYCGLVHRICHRDFSEKEDTDGVECLRGHWFF